MKGKLKTNDVVLVTGIMILFVGSGIYLNPIILDRELPTGDLKIPKAATPVDPIIIRNSSEFADFRADVGTVTGSGTEGDPYIIENFEISDIPDVWPTSAIHLENIHDHLIIRNIRIADFAENIQVLQIVGMDMCSNIIIESLTIENLELTNVINFHGFAITDSKDIQIKNTIATNISVDGSASWLLAALSCERVIFTGNALSNFRATGTNYFHFAKTSSGCINVTFSANTFTDSIFTNDGVLHYYIQQDTGGSFCENIFRNISTVRTSNYLFQCDDYRVENNKFLDLIFEDYVEFCYIFGGSTNCVVTGNFINDITAEEVYAFRIQEGSDCEIFGNHLGTEIQTGILRIIYFAAAAEDNLFYLNYLFHSVNKMESAKDDGTGNQFSAVAFFEPMNDHVYIGNYWVDHSLDGQSGFHYIVETPRPIAGVYNNSDQYPIHYFALDFDGDGLNNYEESELGTDPNNKDSDGDGVDDKSDIEPLNEKVSVGWQAWLKELYTDPVAVGIYGLAVVIILSRIKFKRKNVKGKND